MNLYEQNTTSQLQLETSSQSQKCAKSDSNLTLLSDDALCWGLQSVGFLVCLECERGPWQHQRSLKLKKQGLISEAWPQSGRLTIREGVMDVVWHQQEHPTVLPMNSDSI